MAFSFCRLFLSFHAPSEFMSLFYGTHNKEEGIKKSFGRQKMFGDSEAVRRYFSGQEGED